MLAGVYFSICSLHAFLLAAYFVYIGTSSQRTILFNLSLGRLALILVFLILGVLFLFLAVRSFMGLKKIKTIEEKFLTNESRLWLAFVVSVVMIGISLFLLTLNREVYGSYRELVRQFEPVLVWSVVMGAQTAFFIAIWYCVYFIGKRNAGSIQDAQKELLPLLGLFAGFVLLKMIFVTATAYGPTAASDEMTYFSMAETYHLGIFSPREYNHYQYPPLYPLSIVIPFVFRGWTYEGIKLLNNLFSSSIIFPVYFISRQFLDARKSLTAVFLSCLIPFQLVFPRQIMSENLYFPLLLWAMFITYAAPANKKFRLAWDLLNGFILGALYLTRYITLAALPFLLLTWWIKPFDEESTFLRPGFKKLLHLFLLCVVILAVFCPWPMLGVSKGIRLDFMLGYGVTSNTTSEQLTFSRLLIWSLLYILYFILTAGPLLNVLTIALFQLGFKHLREGSTRWIVQVLVLMGGFFAAGTRHSWRALYNAELPAKIMGRYLAVFPIFYFIIALIVISEFETDKFRSKWQFILAAQLIPFGLAIAAYLMLIKGWLIPTDGALIKPLGSADAFSAQILGSYYLVIIFTIFAITNWMLWAGAKKAAIYALAVGSLVYYLSATPAYYRSLMEYQTYPWLSSQIAEKIPEPSPKNAISGPVSVFVPDDLDRSSSDELYYGLYVRGIEDTQIEISSPAAIEAMKTERGYIIRPLDASSEKYPDSQIVDFYGNEFAIIPVNK